jgi:hypothetical protein
MASIIVLNMAVFIRTFLKKADWVRFLSLFVMTVHIIPRNGIDV